MNKLKPTKLLEDMYAPLYTTKREMGLNRIPPPLHLNCHTHLQPSHSYSWTVTHPFNCHSLNHHTLIIHPHHHTLTHYYTLYLMVESDDPVTMTLSSYCRHSTEPVWPTSSVVTLRDLRSQICSEWRVRSCHNIIPMITTCKSTP